MKPVYSSPHLFWVVYYQDLLKANTIDSVIRNEFLSGGAGELPPNECWPRLYVSDEDFTRAERIVQEELHRKPVDTTPWTCPKCGEQNEGQFALCWNCGTPNELIVL